MQFRRPLRRVTLMDEEVCAIGLKERVEHDGSTPWLARHFLQVSICGIADTRQSDNELHTCKTEAFELAS